LAAPQIGNLAVKLRALQAKPNDGRVRRATISRTDEKVTEGETLRLLNPGWRSIVSSRRLAVMVPEGRVIW